MQARYAEVANAARGRRPSRRATAAATAEIRRRSPMTAIDVKEEGGGGDREWPVAGGGDRKRVSVGIRATVWSRL